MRWSIKKLLPLPHGPSSNKSRRKGRRKAATREAIAEAKNEAFGYRFAIAAIVIVSWASCVFGVFVPVQVRVHELWRADAAAGAGGGVGGGGSAAATAMGAAGVEDQAQTVTVAPGEQGGTPLPGALEGSAHAQLNSFRRFSWLDPLSYSYSWLCFELAALHVLILMLIASLVAVTFRDPGAVPRGYGDSGRSGSGNGRGNKWVEGAGSRNHPTQLSDELHCSLVMTHDQHPDNRTFPRGSTLCRRTGKLRPPRAHYCHQIGRNVLKYDHYCRWVGSPVGLRNYKAYVLVLFYAVSTLATALHVISVRVFSRVFTGAMEVTLPPPGAAFVLALIFAFFVNLPLLVAVIFLAAFHLSLVLTNTTTVEFYIIKRRIKEEGGGERVPPSFASSGISTNSEGMGDLGSSNHHGSSSSSGGGGGGSSGNSTIQGKAFSLLSRVVLRLTGAGTWAQPRFLRYDLGPAANFAAVFGRRPQSWLLPVDSRAQIGSGISFPENPRYVHDSAVLDMEGGGAGVGGRVGGDSSGAGAGGSVGGGSANTSVPGEKAAATAATTLAGHISGGGKS